VRFYLHCGVTDVKTQKPVLFIHYNLHENSVFIKIYITRKVKNIGQYSESPVKKKIIMNLLISGFSASFESYLSKSVANLVSTRKLPFRNSYCDNIISFKRKELPLVLKHYGLNEETWRAIGLEWSGM